MYPGFWIGQATRETNIFQTQRNSLLVLELVQYDLTPILTSQIGVSALVGCSFVGDDGDFSGRFQMTANE